MSIDTSSVLGQRKNTLSTWDILFEENPKEWIGFKPALGLYVYPCYACRHMFSSVLSLQDHVNRRVIVLKYNCAGCSNEIFTFYNRCSFLLHTRKHYGLNEGKINLCELDIFTLPVSLAGFLPHPSIPLLYDVPEEPVAADTYINSQFYSPNISERGKQIVTLKPNDIIFKQPQHSLVLKQICSNIPKCEFVTMEHQRLLRRQNLLAEENNNVNNSELCDPVEIKEESEEPVQTVVMPVISKVESVKEKKFKLPRCLDCNAFQKDTMTEHYLGNNKPVDDRLKCSICGFVASTKCSLKAHVRIHGSLPPFVCPDCGKDFPTWLMLRNHMDDVCFHLAKHVRFRCPGKKCGKIFATSSTFTAHFQVHLKCFITCSICSTVVFKMEDVEIHRTLHQEPCTFKKIFDCPICTHLGTFTEDNYMEHINIHTTDTKWCIYVYLCKFCRSYFRSTTTYAIHLLKCSSKQSSGVQAKNLDIRKYVTRDCENCTNKIIFSEEKPIRFCNRCKTQAVKSKPVITKRYFCILCTKQILMHEKAMHMNVCKYRLPFVSVPKLNLEDLENRSFSSNSSDLDSSSSPKKFERVKRHISSDSSKTDDSAKRRRRVGFPVSSKHRRNDREVQLDLTAEAPMQFDGTYLCKQCDYKNTDRYEFHGHIKEHRDVSTAYQCMECAECFVVKPSLIKHLLHFHNISDHQTYLKENDCYDVNAVRELEDTMKLAPGESKEPVKENQCRVCRQEFEDFIALNKHIRIHGMAFLLRNTK
ncbi:hypothetical protein NQ314_009312 [Rhamnusium bicolor]|uniref:C2H2-type domain-containing protein n=1 Tax=Rhamnusium bicolor TaxID=1586634 RepID=A0AAV8Y1T2_9CUCU|nr:hypothetical protein NQ314_009312 [Rhamnusium bicolor]